jgi:hypothetical protein
LGIRTFDRNRQEHHEPGHVVRHADAGPGPDGAVRAAQLLAGSPVVGALDVGIGVALAPAQSTGDQ